MVSINYGYNKPLIIIFHNQVAVILVANMGRAAPAPTWAAYIYAPCKTRSGTKTGSHGFMGGQFQLQGTIREVKKTILMD